MTMDATDLDRSVDEVRITVRAECHPFACDDRGSRWEARYEVRDYLAPSGAAGWCTVATASRSRRRIPEHRVRGAVTSA
jgi:hypothetical protein